MMQCPIGFIKEVTDMLTERLPNMNKDYLQGIAEVLLSSASWQASVTDKLGTLCLNVWVEMISPSGDGKSIPIDNFLIPVVDEIEKLINTEGERYVLHLENYTGEGILKMFSNNGVQYTKDGEKEKKRTIYNLGLLCKDESTMAIQNAIKKNYMAGIVEIESKMYDGKLYRKITTSRGLENVERCYKASIAATTPAIYPMMQNDGFIQGGWNRYDMIIGNPLKPEDVKRYGDDFFIQQIQMSAFKSIPKEYALKLLGIVKSDPIVIIPDEEATKLWLDFEYEMKVEVVKLPDTDLRRGYLQRQAEKALKRAGLYTISKHFNYIEKYPKTTMTEIDENGEPTTVYNKALICCADDMKMAIDNQREFYKYWLKMLDQRKNIKPESKVTNDAEEMKFFALQCKSKPIVSRRLLVELTGWKDGGRNNKLTENIDSAIYMGDLAKLDEAEKRTILEEHKSKDDLAWFEEMRISPSYKGNLPDMFKWVGK